MISVYVEKATGLPALDRNGLSDPFCNLYGVVGQVFYQFGKTKIIDRTLNPVWDENHTNPFSISFTRISKLHIDLWDYDAVGKDDYMGFVEIPIDPAKFGQSINYPVVTAIPNCRPEIWVMIKFDLFAVTEINKSNSDKSYVTYLTYSPPLTIENKVNLRINNYDARTGAVISLPGYGTIDSTGIELDIQASHYGPAGFTNVATIFPNKENERKLYIPVCNVQGYKGVVTLNVASCVKIPTNSEDNKNIRVCMSQDQQIIKVYKKISVYVTENGTYSFGCVFDLSDSKTLEVNSLCLNRKLQEYLKFPREMTVQDIAHLVYASPFCKYFGLESAFIHEIYHVIEFDHSRYDNILELMTKILARKSNNNSHLVNSLIEYCFMRPKDVYSLNSALLHKLHFLRALLDNNVIQAKLICDAITKIEISQYWLTAFYSTMFFAPELDELNLDFLESAISKFKTYFGNGHGEGGIRDFLPNLPAMRAEGWSQLKALLRDGYQKNTVMASIVNGTIEQDNSIREDSVNSFLKLSIFDRIRSFSQKITPLGYALYYNCCESAKYILSLKPQFTITGVRSYVEYAIRGGNPALLEIISGTKLLQSGHLKTAIEFHNAVIFDKITSLLRIKKFPTVELLKNSISSGNIDIFCRFNANIRILAGDNLEAEYLNAVQNGHINSVDALINHYNVSPTAFGQRGLMPLQLAVNGGDTSMVRFLLSFPEMIPCAMSEDGSVPIIGAIESRNSDMVKVIAWSPTFDPNFALNGRTPLMTAAEIGHTPSLLAILESPPIVQNPLIFLDKRNKDGDTALMIAAKNGHKDAVGALIIAGCDRTIENNEGKKAIDVAANDEIKELLK